MPTPGMPGKGGRMPGMPGKGGQVPPDQGMPNPDYGNNLPPDTGTPPAGGTPPTGTPPTGGEAPPAGGGTPETGTPPADTMTDSQRNILAEQGFTEQEARNAFDAIIQNQEGTLDPRFKDLIGTGYYRRIGEAFGLKDAAGNPVTLGGATAVQGIDYPGQTITRAPSEEQLAQFQQNIPQATDEVIDPEGGQPRTDGGYDSSGINPGGMYNNPGYWGYDPQNPFLGGGGNFYNPMYDQNAGGISETRRLLGGMPDTTQILEQIGQSRFPVPGPIFRGTDQDERQPYTPSTRYNSLLRGIGSLGGIGGGMIPNFTSPDFSGMLQRVTQ